MINWKRLISRKFHIFFPFFRQHWKILESLLQPQLFCAKCLCRHSRFEVSLGCIFCQLVSTYTKTFWILHEIEIFQFSSFFQPYFSWRRALLGLQLPSGSSPRKRNLLPMWCGHLSRKIIVKWLTQPCFRDKHTNCNTENHIYTVSNKKNIGTYAVWFLKLFILKPFTLLQNQFAVKYR